MLVGAMTKILDSLDWFPLLVLACWSAMAHLSATVFMPLVTMGVGIEIGSLCFLKGISGVLGEPSWRIPL